MDDSGPRKKEDAGAPAWVMTFADLMSLLMCFFVLLLSFSEMDVSKYKQIAGSMAHAFGVQREIKVKEAPKGINIIAQEFSAGRPDPTPFNVVRQMTADDIKPYLDLSDKRRRGRPAQRVQSGAPGQDQGQGQGAAQARSAAQADAQADAAAQGAPASGPEQALTQAQAEQMVLMPRQDAINALRAKALEEQQEALEHNADKIRAALHQEIEQGAVDVETTAQKILIRIREKASFPSGFADLRPDFRPILVRVGRILKDTEGQILVAGHTDDVPIHNHRFRSNWELSATRAASVVHELIGAAGIDPQRVAIEGHAETEPVAANDTPAHRAMNRRVEIILIQGEDLEAQGQISALRRRGSGAATPPSPDTAPTMQGIKRSRPASGYKGFSQ